MELTNYIYRFKINLFTVQRNLFPVYNCVATIVCQLFHNAWMASVSSNAQSLHKFFNAHYIVNIDKCVVVKVTTMIANCNVNARKKGSTPNYDDDFDMHLTGMWKIIVSIRSSSSTLLVDFPYNFLLCMTAHVYIENKSAMSVDNLLFSLLTFFIMNTTNRASFSNCLWNVFLFLFTLY